MAKGKILPQIKLKYYQQLDEHGERPKHADLACGCCGRTGITVGGMRYGSDGTPSPVCEECMIDDFMKKNKYSSREAAVAARRRMFDVGYLFNEMVTDKYIDIIGADNIDDLNEREMRTIMEKGKDYFNSLFSRSQKIKMEEMEDQAEIEKIMRGRLDRVKLYNLREKKPVEFSRDQFETLLKLAYTGDWVINAVRVGNKEYPHIEEYQKLTEYIYSKAEDFGLENLIDFDRSSGKYYPSRRLEEDEEMRYYIDYYEDDVFFNDLVARFEDRDFFRAYGEEAISKMSVKERFHKRQPFYEKYFDEFSVNDIERLEIVDK